MAKRWWQYACWQVNDNLINFIHFNLLQKKKKIFLAYNVFTDSNWNFIHRAVIKDDDKSLIIKNVIPADEGIYICDGHNGVGQISAKAQLVVNCTSSFSKCKIAIVVRCANHVISFNFSSAKFQRKTTRSKDWIEWHRIVWLSSGRKSTTVHILGERRFTNADVSRQFVWPHLRDESRNIANSWCAERGCRLLCVFSIECCWFSDDTSIFASHLHRRYSTANHTNRTGKSNITSWKYGNATMPCHWKSHIAYTMVQRWHAAANKSTFDHCAKWT